MSPSGLQGPAHPPRLRFLPLLSPKLWITHPAHTYSQFAVTDVNLASAPIPPSQVLLCTPPPVNLAYQTPPTPAPVTAILGFLTRPRPAQVPCPVSRSITVDLHKPRPTQLHSFPVSSSARSRLPRPRLMQVPIFLTPPTRRLFRTVTTAS